MSTPLPFDAYIFDLDGTLLDTLPDLVVLTNEVLETCGYPTHDTATIQSFVGGGLEQLMELALPDLHTHEDVERAMEAWKIIHPIKEGRLTTPYPHMIETLQELRARGAKTAVLSNKYDQGVQDVMDHFMPGLFDVRHGECADIPRKPDPTGLLQTLDELGVTAGQAVYVGDAPSDLEVARTAGVAARCVTWGYHVPEDFPPEAAPIFISDPRELLG